MPPSAPASPAPVVVALLDSGVNPAHPHLGGADWAPGFGVVDSGSSTDLDDDSADLHGHGTALAAAVLGFHPRARLLPVRVLDRDLRASSRALCRAVVEAAARGARVLNLSLGTASPEAAGPLAEAIEAARVAGAVAVAAAAPMPSPSWPADLPTAVSVRWDVDCPPGAWYRLDETLLLPDGRAAPLPRFASHGRPRAAEGRDPRGNFSGSSMACARLTAAVAELLETRPDLGFEAVVDHLRAASAGPLPPGHRLR